MMLNPILEREIKSKMRSWKAPIAILVYLFFIGLITYFGMSILSIGRMSGGFNPRAASEVFDFITIFQLGLIMFIVPMIAATSISGERERQTLDLMLCTNISPMSIIFGKIFSALSTVLLLIVMATPFLSISFVLGGISFLDVLTIIVYYIASAFYISTIAVFSSTQFKKNITAIIMSYVIMGVLYCTPFVIVFSALTDYGSNNIIVRLMETESLPFTAALFGSNPVYGLLSLLTNGKFMLGSLESQSMPFLTSIPTWIFSIIWFVIISAIMLLLARRNLKKKEF